MDENLRREIIMEHYQNPRNKKTMKDDTYEKVNTNNASCIDNLDLFIKIEDQKVIVEVFKYITKCKNITKFVVEEPTLNEIFIEKVGASYEK